MLNISIVLYHPNWTGELQPLLDELLKVHELRKIYLVDNSEQSIETQVDEYRQSIASFNRLLSSKLRYIFNGQNLGYGRAHNIALRESIYYRTPFHLVINSDIRVSAADIDAMLAFMLSQPEVGQLMPRVINPDGSQQYLAKRLPSPLDVFSRRFLPSWLIARRNRKYELRDRDLSRPQNAPYLSGCFMFLRTEAAHRAGLFDERFFMYPEDIDLTRRIHRNYLTLYYPEWTITHVHAHASYKEKHMLRIHIQNMCLYFCKWGWLFDSERRRFNRLDSH